MMGIYIKGMEMPESCHECFAGFGGGCCFATNADEYMCPDHGRAPWCPLVEVPAHGRLIDADALHDAMYHRAFETDGDTMWQSGCWVRYRAIEQVHDAAPTIIPAEEEPFVAKNATTIPAEEDKP